jgi:hypothetical protein
MQQRLLLHGWSQEQECPVPQVCAQPGAAAVHVCRSMPKGNALHAARSITGKRVFTHASQKRARTGPGLCHKIVHLRRGEAWQHKICQKKN